MEKDVRYACYQLVDFLFPQDPRPLCWWWATLLCGPLPTHRGVMLPISGFFPTVERIAPLFLVNYTSYIGSHIVARPFLLLLFFFPPLCTAEEKEPYEAKARQDKKRYKDEISGYKNPQPMNIDSGNESDSE